MPTRTLLCLFFLWFFLATTPAWSAVSEEDLLLVEFALGREVLSEELPTFPTPRGVLLPFGELSRLLGLALEVEPQNGFVKGFILQEDRSFTLDAGKGEAWLNGKRLPFEPSLVELQPDEIFVDSILLQRWLPLEIKFDPFAARIQAFPKESFPVEERLKRERRSISSGNAGSESRLASREIPHELWSPPFLDQSFSLNHLDPGYSSYASGDLFNLDGNLYLRGSRLRPLSDIRLTLGRKDPEARLPFHARRFSIGAYELPGVPLISSPHQGRGLSFDNHPLTVQNQFDSHSFRGDLPPGWEVELYQNDILMGYQQSRDDGRYQFDNLPLLTGINEFRLVFYGPQGQRRQEIKRFNIEDSLTRPSETRYRITSGWGEDGRPRTTAQGEFGLDKQLSAHLGYAAQAGKSYGTTGLRGFWNEYFLHGDLAFAQNGGSIAEIGAQANYGEVDLDLRHSILDHFQSELFPNHGDPLRSRTQCSLNASRLFRKDPPFSLGLDLQQSRTQSGRTLHQYVQRSAITWQGVSLTNHLDWNFQHPPTEGFPSFNQGGFQLSYRRIRYGVRLELGYSPSRPDNLILSTDWNLRQGAQLELNLNRSLQSAQNQLSLNLNLDTGKELIGLFASLQDQNLSLGSTLSFSLVPDSSARWYRNSMPSAESGASSVKVYLDTNENGRFDEADRPLEGVGLAASGSGLKTDSEGSAFFPKLTPFQALDFVLFPETLEDPLWTPRQLGIRLMPRPGRTAALDFPVILTSELNGTLYLRTEETLRPAGGIVLELLDAEGTVRQKVRTAYDGFYTFSQVPPGTYRLRPDTLKYVLVQSAKIRVEAGKSFDALNLLLEPAPAALSGIVYLRGKDALFTPKGVGLELSNVSGTIVRRTVTDEGGHYSFPSLPPGNYALRLTKSKGYGVVYPSLSMITIRAAGCYDKANILLEKK